MTLYHALEVLAVVLVLGWSAATAWKTLAPAAAAAMRRKGTTKPEAKACVGAGCSGCEAGGAKRP